MSQKLPTAYTAELCTPIKGVSVIKNGGNIRFQKDGYVAKEFRADELPDKIRLLEDKLIGYQAKLWFSPGERIKSFIHAPEVFTAKIFRHGLEKKLISDLGHFSPQQQQVPDGHFVEEGLNWRKSIEYTMPNDALPGIYSLLLQSAEEKDFAIPFVVSTSPSCYGIRSKILVLASATTWQSYNLWGGRSRYRNFEDSLTGSVSSTSVVNPLKIAISRVLPENTKKTIKKLLGKQDPKWMFKKLTVKRPFTNCDLEESDSFRPFTNHLASGEWRLLAWLEREGYDYDIISGYELHANPKLLENYKALILNTHCEYWTRAMFEGLKHFHEEKQGWILNISGNSIYREIEFFADGSTRCVSLSFKDSCQDEAQILGVRFSSSDYATCAPYKILKPNHWVFQGMSISKSKIFGGLSLNQNTQNTLDGAGASGWETDKICKSSPRDIKLVAKGLNPKGGADMVVREPNGKRGGMFSASSIVFGGCLLIDNVSSMIVKNVLSRALKAAGN